jgi:hypothetical protein
LAEGVLAKVQEILKTKYRGDNSLEIIEVSSKVFKFELILRAAAIREVKFKVGTEEPESAFDRRPRHVDQITKALSFVEADNLAELLQERLSPLSLLHFF